MNSCGGATLRAENMRDQNRPLHRRTCQGVPTRNIRRLCARYREPSPASRRSRLAEAWQANKRQTAHAHRHHTRFPSPLGMAHSRIHSSFPASAVWPVVRHYRSGKKTSRILAHALRFQRLEHQPNPVVHHMHHRGIDSSFLILNLRIPRDRLLGSLQRRMRGIVC